jgi:23S rRNA pseudouridine2457 synthase
VQGRRTRPARVRLLREPPALPPRPVPVRLRKSVPTAWLEIGLREGRNRQVRRMCDAIGHPAERLRRTRIGPVADPGLKPGRFRDLTPAEVSKLMGPHGRDRAKSSTHGSSSSLNRSQNRASRQ